MSARYRSADAQRVHLDAIAADQYYSAICICGHQRRQHGQIKCFAPACTCRGGCHTAPTSQVEAKEREEQILKELGYYPEK